MAVSKGPHVGIMRSPLGRALGLGAGHSGAKVWVSERVTSIALIPLTIWFVFSVLSLVGASWATMHVWASKPFHTAMLLALIAATFRHMQLGLQVVIEDYVHNECTKTASILAVRGVIALLALMCAVATLKLALMPLVMPIQAL